LPDSSHEDETLAPAHAQTSPDGRFVWDGAAWQPADQQRTGPQQPPSAGAQVPGQVDRTGRATASLVLGIVGLIAWLIPLIGFPVTITGLVMGFQGQHSSKKAVATAGIVLSIIALVLTVINSAVGAYLGATGHLN
jgi:hypothetical protein